MVVEGDDNAILVVEVKLRDGPLAVDAGISY
jgi:hypothetical protein